MNNKTKMLIPFVYVFLAQYSSHLLGAQLSLEINGKNIKPGKLHVAFYRVHESTKKPAGWGDVDNFRKELVDYPPHPEKNELLITDLQPGRLCVRVFLDLNENQQLDRSFVGLPLEPVGFANNPSLFLGEPEPDEGCFELTQGHNVQSINLKQKKAKTKHKRKFRQ